MKTTPLNNIEKDGHIGQMLSEISTFNYYARVLLVLLFIANTCSLLLFIFPCPDVLHQGDGLSFAVDVFGSLVVFFIVFMTDKRLKAVLRLYKEERSKMQNHK